MKDNIIASSAMLALINGRAVSYRFKLSDGDYHKTVKLHAHFMLADEFRSVPWVTIFK